MAIEGRESRPYQGGAEGGHGTADRAGSSTGGQPRQAGNRLVTFGNLPNGPIRARPPAGSPGPQPGPAGSSAAARGGEWAGGAFDPADLVTEPPSPGAGNGDQVHRDQGYRDQSHNGAGYGGARQPEPGFDPRRGGARPGEWAQPPRPSGPGQQVPGFHGRAPSAEPGYAFGDSRASSGRAVEPPGMDVLDEPTPPPSDHADPARWRTEPGPAQAAVTSQPPYQGPQGAGGSPPAGPAPTLLDEVSFTGHHQPIPEAPGSRPGPGRPGPGWPDAGPLEGRPVRGGVGPDPTAGRLRAAFDRYDDPADDDAADAAPRSRRRNPFRTIVKIALIGALIVVGVSIGRTLALPGDQGTLSRMADWARDHHLSVVVDQVDRFR